jgi:hypothetical protein
MGSCRLIRGWRRILAHMTWGRGRRNHARRVHRWRREGVRVHVQNAIMILCAKNFCRAWNFLDFRYFV